VQHGVVEEAPAEAAPTCLVQDRDAEFRRRRAAAKRVGPAMRKMGQAAIS
jgi:hypothetical protein